MVWYNETLFTCSCESTKLTSSTTGDSLPVVIGVTYRRVSIWIGMMDVESPKKRNHALASSLFVVPSFCITIA